MPDLHVNSSVTVEGSDAASIVALCVCSNVSAKLTFCRETEGNGTKSYLASRRTVQTEPGEWEARL